MLARSTDQGKTWVALNSGSADGIYDVAQTKSGELLLLGLRSGLSTSSDQGKTWQRETTAKASEFYSLLVLPSGEIYLVGGGGMIVRSNAP